MVGWREDIVFWLKYIGRRLVLEVYLIKVLSFVVFYVDLYYKWIGKYILKVF